SQLGKSDNSDQLKVSARNAYFASLAEWTKQMAAAQMLCQYMIFHYNCQFLEKQMELGRQMSQVPRAVRPQFGVFTWYNEAEQQEIVQRLGGTEAIAAPFWKRVVAELIDVIIIIVVKLVTAFIIVFSDLNIDFERIVGSKALKGKGIFLSLFDVSMDFIKLSTEFFFFIILTKLLVCFYECLCMTFNNGATPGKEIMKLRVLYVEAVVPLQQMVMPVFIFQIQREPFWVMLYPAEQPTFMRSFMRTFAKNLVVTLFFPICLILIFLRNNRTTYDIISKTIVVETDTLPSTPNDNDIRQPRL
ncbi:hypothetical protein KR222_004971, partial [Zaprionus bogoriensis]